MPTINDQLRTRDRSTSDRHSKNEENRTVKRTVGLTKLAALGIAVYLGTQLWAQVPGQPAPTAPAPAAARPLQTRIGLVNMVKVLKEYKKFQVIEEPIKKRSQELEATLNGYRIQMNKLKEEYNQPNTAQARKEAIEKESRELQMRGQMAEEDAKKELTKKQGDAAVQIYQEVKAAVDSFAATYGYEAVFFYNDAITPEDMMHPANVQRKLLQPACLMPLYYAPGMDISAAIVANLNARYQQSAPAAPPAAPVGGAPPH
jgi:Skp family chaperone for outer membrane proteins